MKKNIFLNIFLILPVLAIFFTLFLQTRHCFSQSIQERVLMPPAGLSSGGDPFLISLNPATMALNASWEGVFYHSQLGSQEFIAGNGDAFYITSPALWIFHLGFGFENTRPPDAWKQRWLIAEGRQTGNWSMLTFALAVRLGESASLGANIRTYMADENETYHRLTSWDAGAHFHPSPFMSLTFSAMDISTPKLKGNAGSIERTWGLGISVRPLGRDILTFSLDNLFGQTSENDIIRAFIELKPVRGVSLQGLMEMWIGDTGFMDDAREIAFQASLGLRFELPYLGIFGASHMGNRMDSPFLGFTAGLRVSGQYYLSMIMPRRVVKIDMEGELGGEELVELFLYLEEIRKEASIKGVLFRMKNFSALPGQAQEIVRVIDRLKSSGKYVFCYETGLATSASTYACSHADGYYFSPVGGTMLSGTRMSLFYYTGLMRKIGINAQIFRIGEYKSFPERVTMEGPSEASSKQYRELLHDIYNSMLADISRGRNFTGQSGKADEIIKGGPYNSQEAVEMGLGDGVLWEDELKEKIEKKIGRKVVITKKFDFSTRAPDRWNMGRRIGVIVISGTIIDGPTRKIPLAGIETAGCETLVKAIDEARKNPAISAVVLRVDSGGGSAIASEKIWRAVKRLAEKKPVVASFGSIAASGGYYVAASSDEIFALPSTITGSIGVFMGKVELSELMKKAGISVAVFKEGSEKADINAFYRPYTEDEEEKLKKELNYVYNIFLSRVASGRKMKKTEVDQLGRGRVWSGVKARENGLVDKTGSFLDALDRARKLAKLPYWAPAVSLTKKSPGILEKIIESSISDDLLTGRMGLLVRSSIGNNNALKALLPALFISRNNVPMAMMEFIFSWED